MRRQTGKPPAGLVGPPPPPGYRALWQAFLDLHATRLYTDGGMPQAITYAEMQAWGRMHGRPLTAADAAVVRALDAEYRKAMSGPAPSADADDDWSD